MLLSSLSLVAQDITYNSTVDEIWAGRVFKELDGKYAGTSRSDSYTTWPSNDKTVMVYCLRVPKAHVRADAVLAPRSGKQVTLNLRVVNANTGEEVLTHTATTTNTSAVEQTVEIMPDFVFPADTWYRFEITSPNGNNCMSRFSKLRFQRKSSLAVGDSPIFMAPSVHLFTYGTTDPEAPSGESYDWMYQEVMLPPQYEHPNTYPMVIGTDAGYSGIQSTLDNKGGYYHHVIFSVWDNGDTDKDPAMPEYLKSGIVDKGENVIGVRFGGEGTGSSARLTNGYWWTPGKWVQFLWNSRPENVQVTLTGHDGKDSIANYQNTLESCWYKMADETEWHYIATLRESGRNHYYSAFYSFLENFTDAGGELVRRAYYRNAAMRSIASGKWYARNSVGFGHTQNDGSRFSRKDYGHGATSVYDNCFFLQQGGFGQICDSASVLPLPQSTPWVDTINVAALTARVDEAIRRDEAAQALSRVESYRKIDMRGWKLTNFSDEETSGEGENGRAAQAIDGNNSTYWHSQWKPSKASFPHYLIMDAGVETTIDGISLYQERESKYRAKGFRLLTSEDGKTWRTRKSGTFADSNNPEFKLGTEVTSRYFKLDITSSYGGEVLAINEVTFTCRYDIARMLNSARTIINAADHLGGYRKSDLQTLIQVYDGGNCTDTLALKDALEALADVMPLKFGVVNSIDNISSTRCYQLHNITQHAVLATDASAFTSLLIPDGEENAVDSCANWFVLRSEAYGQYFIYNLATGHYLTEQEGHFALSAVPQSITIAKASKGFRIGKQADVYQLLDNYVMAPDMEHAYSLLAECELMPRLGQELRELCCEAVAAYGEAFEHIRGTSDLAKASSRWTSNVNVTNNSSHPISYLCDGNVGTYYETWYSSIAWPKDKSYIQLRLAKAQPGIYFKFTPSQSADYGLSDMPVEMTVFGSADNKAWDQVAVLRDDFPTSIKETYTSPIIDFGKTYQYIRFQVDRTHGNRDGGNHIFAISEFNAYAVTQDEARSPYNNSEGVKTAADRLQTVLATVRSALAEDAASIDHLYLLQEAIDELRLALQNAATGVGAPSMPLTSDNQAVYDLQGRRVQRPQKGVYIQGGRKLIP